MGDPAISIVMRSHNDEPYIGRTLAGFRNQRCSRSFEIVSMDDSSTDRSREIIAEYPDVRRIDPPPGVYIPGKTLNAAVRACRGEVVVFNNADAIPLDDEWLERLTAPLFAEPEVAAAFANQLPRPDAFWLVRKDSYRAYGDGKTAAKWDFFFSLASSAARRGELTEYPFSLTLRSSEDIDWAWRATRRGRLLRYVPEARVEHSHNYGWTALGKRFYSEGDSAAQIFGTVPGLCGSLVRAGIETLRDFAFLAVHPSGWRELPAAPVRRLIQKLAFRRGGLAALARKQANS